ncbi:MAG: response regulator transcription factor [Acidobacteriota bacterium]|nr:response regulator transcription factor [Acidobacteriota bacterium]MDE3043988.1 response regulator transcription factor [Acidobacteriota bacterium]MDE3107907.1 response regulator transcription factor [Acidobacteriota bacterium]MDE3221891.1 response regulator transcription factor [Acidobacteriota bacterium]
MRILIVEDDAGIASFVVKGLRAEGYVALVAGNAPDAERHLLHATEPFDLVLLDLGLPGMSGEELLQRVRNRGVTIPIIILTARTGTGNKVRGLDLGANDYVTKPFAFEELLARIRSAVRSSNQPTSTELVVGDLRLDLFTKIAQRDGVAVELAPREWALLELFMRHPTHVLSRSRILAEVWSYDFDPGSNVVDVYVGYLRRKLNRPGLEPLFKAVRGAGYRLR